MALVPSCQFYPSTATFIDSFHSSFCGFHFSTHLQFFRYASSIPFRNRKFFAIQNDAVNSDSTARRNPLQEPNFSPINTNGKLGFTRDSSIPQFEQNSSGGWLEKWSDNHVQRQPKKPQAILKYRSSENLGHSDYDGSSDSDGRGSLGGTGSTMQRIVEKLKKFGYIDDVNEKNERAVDKVIERGSSIEDIFHVEEGNLPNARGGFSPESPLGVEDIFRISGVVRFPWEKPSREEEEARKNSARLKSRTSLAELTLPQSELQRLRNLSIRTKNKTRIGSAGVSKEMVDLIHDKWKSSEIVRLKIEGAAALNMKRMHEILERKTGGLVIWRSGTSVALYRGIGYELPSERQNKQAYKIYQKSSSSEAAKGIKRSPLGVGTIDNMQASQADFVNADEEKASTELSSESKYEYEVDKLLQGLGPRYTDWAGNFPLPVDADLLPRTVPGFEPPFRILPYGIRPSLGGKEATDLRRLTRVLPPHFALGRSRQHEGLAMAMIKLWERSSIAKIALKRGIQLTTSERMAEEIKKLTGGVLLSRNKDFLVFYRGKNFLSPDVAEALLEKERLAKSLQDEEEQARLRALSVVTAPSTEIDGIYGTAGTLGETLNADSKWGKRLDDKHKKKVLREAEAMRQDNLVRKLQRKLAFANRKLIKAERALSKLEEFLNPADRPADPGSISDEERFMFRKLGLRMKAFLLLGRRGVFDGTVENMHLHWKYRELVKIIVKAKNFEEVKNIALSLEAESGGVLVSVDKVSKGYAIVVFRGKDYKRPSALRPKNLLTKRKALARSIELQRREALLSHISALQGRVDILLSEIGQISALKNQEYEELYDRLDSAYPTEEGDSEEDEDEMYLETYQSDDVEDDRNDSIDGLCLETTYDFQDHESETEPSNQLPAAVELFKNEGYVLGEVEKLQFDDVPIQKKPPSPLGAPL